MEFLVPSSLDPDHLPAELARCGYRVREGRKSRHRFRLFDTFDWRLLSHGLELIQRRGRFHLHAADDGREIAYAPAAGSGKRAWLSHHFPDGPLRDALGKIIEIRAVLPLVDVTGEERTWEIRNADDKRVLRCRRRALHAARVTWRGDPHPPPPTDLPPPSPLHLLCVEPVTGYSKPVRDAETILDDQGLTHSTDRTEELFRQAGFDPAAPAKKPVLGLQPDWPAARATLEILRHQYRVARLNERGVLADLDTEFLHDFRVALRRSRSAMARIKKSLPPAATRHFRARLAEVARTSNRLRDLDVHLLQRDAYRQMLPPELHAGLDTFFALLAEERQHEFRKVVRYMRGADYRRTMDEWGAFLAVHDPQLPEAAGANALTPVRPLAEKTIAKACSRLLRRGRTIGPNAPDEALHALRLDCKKLRYLFEFFAELFPEGEIRPLIKRAKRLQDLLGEFNDLFVQRETLRHGLLRLAGDGPGSPPAEAIAAAAAAGGLITHLERRRSQVRRNFAKTFTAFEQCRHRRRFCPDD